MNTMLVITYVGLVVAILIIVWGISTLFFRRYASRKKPDASVMHSWVPLTVSTTTTSRDASATPDEDEDDDEEAPQLDLHAKAQQNGHHSESQRKL